MTSLYRATWNTLKYADVNESLNIFENIALVYLRRKLFDSAFYFLQKSFDQVKPGINESGLSA